MKMSLFLILASIFVGGKQNSKYYDLIVDIKFESRTKDSTEEYNEKDINVEAENILGEHSNLYPYC